MKRFCLAVILFLFVLTAVSCGKKPDSSSSKTSGSSEIGSSSSAADLAESSSDVSSSSPSSDSAESPSSSDASSSQPVKESVTVLIPPGFTVTQIGDRLQANGVCSSSDFINAVNTYPFTESVMSQVPNDPNRCFRLEWYLYPNTYQFYKNMKAQDAVGKMLRSADTNIYGKYDDKTIIIASIIEQETANNDDMKNVSSVIHNRLNAKMQLQLDSTIYYIEQHVKPYLTGDINRYNSFYNTYKCAALPEGPICSPSRQALDAAANPSNTNYLYFGSDASGKYLFSPTYIDPKALGK